MSLPPSVDPLDEAERLLPLFPETALALLHDAARCGDPEDRTRALALLALHDATARSGEGLRRARERLQRAEEHGAVTPLARGWLAHVRGYLAYREASDDEALRSLDEAAALWVDHPRLRARSFDALGMLLGRRGDLDGAFDYFALALQHKQGSDDPRSLAVTYGNLGRLALLAERHDEAERWLRLDLERVLAATERPATVAHVRNQLALALAGQGRHDEARSELREALALAPAGTVVRAYLHKDLARMALDRGDEAEAQDHAEAMRREVEGGSFAEARPWLWLLDAELSLRKGDPERAWPSFAEAWRGFVERQDPPSACEAALRWARALAERGEPGRAQRVLEDAVQLAEVHLFRQENPLARLEDALDRLGAEGAAAVLRGRVRRMLGGVSEHWLLERRSGAYHRRRLRGERAWLTVWTCDLRGFTEACARTEDPQQVVRMLNRFFARVGQALLEQGGCIDKYVGDSILAYFQGEGAAGRACEATAEAFRRLAALNSERAHLGEPELRMGVGIATGWAVEGNVGFAGKLEHTIIGTPVNTACRLVARAAGGQALLDEATSRELGERRELTSAGLVELKGLGEVQVFELTPGSGRT
jgi:class 3 adenylate cyclase/Flp pilus assembly protein TadD